MTSSSSSTTNCSGSTISLSSSNIVASCSCPVSQNLGNNHLCPICLLKFNNSSRLPLGLNLVHNIICQKCVMKLHPNQETIVNLPLLVFLDFSIDHIENQCQQEQEQSCSNHKDEKHQDGNHPTLNPNISQLDPALKATVKNLISLTRLAKSVAVSRAILKKVSSLLVWLTPVSQGKLIKHCKSLGNRILLELIGQNQASNYRAQQQLWAAIRSKACIFVGPALQDEALRLVLLALEDGSALSKKVLIMFVVQRLLPQFPQASKTSIGHIIQLLYRGSCFQFIKQDNDSSNLMTLKEEYRNYEAIRREHDSQIIKIGLESGLHFSPDQWSHVLYGDNLHKSLMQSILDKLTEPQSFSQLTTEFLITIQRLQDETQSKLLSSIHPDFEKLASIDLNSIDESWSTLVDITTMLVKVLNVLIEQKVLLMAKRKN